MSLDHGHMDMPMPMPMPPNHNMNMDDTMMRMNFYWGKDAIILFQGWPKHSLGMYILSLAFVFLLAIVNEVLSLSPALRPGTSPLFGGLTQASIYALRTALSYMIMLSVMSFNLGIFIVAVAGHALGFFFVKWRSLAMASNIEANAKTDAP